MNRIFWTAVFVAVKSERLGEAGGGNRMQTPQPRLTILLRAMT